jgi:hypothetical protein
MGAYSTLRVTRSKAIRMLLEHVMGASNEVLGRWMDDILRDRLYNCTVVDDGDENDEERL